MQLHDIQRGRGGPGLVSTKAKGIRNSKGMLCSTPAESVQNGGNIFIMFRILEASTHR